MPNPWSQKDKNSEVLSSYLSESELNEYKQLSILERDPSTPSSQFSITPFFSLFGQDWFGLHFQENVREGISLSKKITWSSLVLFPHFPTYIWGLFRTVLEVKRYLDLENPCQLHKYANSNLNQLLKLDIQVLGKLKRCIAFKNQLGC